MGPFNFQNDNAQAAGGASSEMNEIEMIIAELVQTKEVIATSYYGICDMVINIIGITLRMFERHGRVKWLSLQSVSAIFPAL